MTEIKQIVVGVDGSESSRAALHWAYDEAAHHGASLVAVSTWHPPALPMSPPYGHLPPEGYESQPERDARELLGRLAALGQHGTWTRWNQGCSCPQCRQVQSDGARTRGRAKAQARFPTETRLLVGAPQASCA